MSNPLSRCYNTVNATSELNPFDINKLCLTSFNLRQSPSILEAKLSRTCSWNCGRIASSFSRKECREGDSIGTGSFNASYTRDLNTSRSFPDEQSERCVNKISTRWNLMSFGTSMRSSPSCCPKEFWQRNASWKNDWRG